jgi:hypothetical protein
MVSTPVPGTLPAATSGALSASNIVVPPRFPSFQAAARHWYHYGFKTLPIVPGEKRASLPWHPWLEQLSVATIDRHWLAHPDHELGSIVGDDMIVFDADTPEAVAQLCMLEKRHRVAPKLVVNTTRGQHHYFRLAADAFAKSDSHDTKQFPLRIDVKTGWAQIILPPSTGKSLKVFSAKNKEDLSEASQDFIDAVFKANGRSAPRPPDPNRLKGREEVAPKASSDDLSRLLKCLDPDMGYDNWVRVLMAIFFETKGHEDGLDLAIRWSAKGDKYKGDREITEKWRSFDLDHATPVRLGTLIAMVTDAGHDLAEILGPPEPFERCGTEVVQPDVRKPTTLTAPTPLDRYSLLGKSDEIERQAVEQTPILGQIVLKGQATAIYAEPNSGKTATTVRLLIDAISEGRIDPSKVYYLNMDDSGQGLLIKNRIAEEYGFHMLSEGYRGFEASKFIETIGEIIANDQARGVIIVLDTLKKFTDLMDKKASSRFTRFARAFVLKGGTLIALAHTNKNRDAQGRPVPSGTSDIKDDFDCAYTISAAEDGYDKIAHFKNIKRRGDVPERVAYRFSNVRGISYHDLLLSIALVDDSKIEDFERIEEIRSDSDVITAVATAIESGIKTKMKLGEAVAAKLGISRRKVNTVIEKYTGTDPKQHRWSFERRERGAQVFALLTPVPSEPG